MLPPVHHHHSHGDTHTGVRPVLLDLYCGGGGAARGYSDAGFRVLGVDVVDQPHYPCDFWRVDVRDLSVNLLAQFDAVHASPPCQRFTQYRHCRWTDVARGITRSPDDRYPDLVSYTRALLEAADADGPLLHNLPWVIENVTGAPLWLSRSVRLCGSSFGLDVRRHRYFESNVPLWAPPCVHDAHYLTPRFPSGTTRTNLRRTVAVGEWRVPLDVQQRAMGIDWLRGHSLSEAVPPAYTRFVGHQLLAHLNRDNRSAPQTRQDPEQSSEGTSSPRQTLVDQVSERWAGAGDM